MLTLTENASTVVKPITDQTTETEGAGLRISHEPPARDLSADSVRRPVTTPGFG